MMVVVVLVGFQAAAASPTLNGITKAGMGDSSNGPKRPPATTFGMPSLRILPKTLCLWASKPHDLVCSNIKHLAGQIRGGNWATLLGCRLGPAHQLPKNRTSGQYSRTPSG